MGVPASNLYGNTLYVVFSKLTCSIISPPPSAGGNLSSHSFLPYSTPKPVGPYILCALKTKKSQSSCFTSITRCGTDCAPSTQTAAPRSCAKRIISSMGLIVPNTLLTCAIDTNFVFSLSNSLNATISSDKSSHNGITFSTAPLRSHSICHGTIFEWCSNCDTIISSPCSTIASPKLRANILRLSVVPLVKIISSDEWA